MCRAPPDPGAASGAEPPDYSGRPAITCHGPLPVSDGPAPAALSDSETRTSRARAPRSPRRADMRRLGCKCDAAVQLCRSPGRPGRRWLPEPDPRAVATCLIHASYPPARRRRRRRATRLGSASLRRRRLLPNDGRARTARRRRPRAGSSGSRPGCMSGARLALSNYHDMPEINGFRKYLTDAHSPHACPEASPVGRQLKYYPSTHGRRWAGFLT